MLRVLGIDVASGSWRANGSALLSFERGAGRFVDLVVPAIAWPSQEPLTPSSLAKAIDQFARGHRVSAIALDGPQGWRDPQTPADARGVGRRCEWECRTQGKTGVLGRCYPGTQRAWIEFSIQIFDALLTFPGVSLATGIADGNSPDGDGGYVILEVFPTSAWKTSGLTALPGKANRPELKPFAEALFATYGIGVDPGGVRSHDDLQAVVAALCAAGVVGGPVQALPAGSPPSSVFDGTGKQHRVEGFIWNVSPIGASASHYVQRELRKRPPASPPAGPSARAETTATSYVRVTSGVVAQVTRTKSRTQQQIGLVGFPGGNRQRPVSSDRKN